jgi:hypothetical protein
LFDLSENSGGGDVILGMFSLSERSSFPVSDGSRTHCGKASDRIMARGKPTALPVSTQLRRLVADGFPGFAADFWLSISVDFCMDAF